jgi:hypothetical protein
LVRGGNSTRDLSFAEFLEAYLEDSRPAFAKIGDPYQFVCDKNEQVGVDRLFRYEDLDKFFRFASERFDTNIVAPNLNVSPSQECDVPHDLLLRVRQKLASSFELYESIGIDNDFRAKRRAANAANKDRIRNRKRPGGEPTPQVVEARLS